MRPDLIKAEIECLKNDLNALIQKGAGFNTVYKASIKLDKLIVRYYNQKNHDRLDQG